ncbi:MAG TPA: RDD family protein [Pseudonocardiaceae bacterium]|nr:RDD family protein [Pseudonocardiaceae bacterium]
MSLPPEGRPPYPPQQPPGRPHPQQPHPQQPYPQPGYPPQYQSPQYQPPQYQPPQYQQPGQPGYPAPVQQQPGQPPAPGYAQPGPPPTYQPPVPGRPSSPSIVHGSAGDPRYPSPRTLRRTLGFTVDLLLHLGCAVGAFFGSKHVPSLSHLPTVWAIVAWFVVSFVHRVLIQWATQASLGKALFGLRLVRPVDGGRVGFGMLVKAWLVSIWATILTVGSIAGSASGDVDENSFMLPVVRRRDIRALRGR